MKFLLLGIALLSTSASAADLAGKIVRIKPLHSQKCLNSMDKSDSQGASIVQWSCSDQAHQRFELVQNTDGFFFITSTGSKLCFGVPYAMYGLNGITLRQVTCNTTQNHSNEFSLHLIHDDIYTIRPRRAQNTCLGVINGTLDVFAGVAQEPCANKLSQQFHLVIE